MKPDDPHQPWLATQQEPVEEDALNLEPYGDGGGGRRASRQQETLTLLCAAFLAALG
jgi:hypothetical protein